MTHIYVYLGYIRYTQDRYMFIDMCSKYSNYVISALCSTVCISYLSTCSSIHITYASVLLIYANICITYMCITYMCILICIYTCLTIIKSKTLYIYIPVCMFSSSI